MRKRGRKLKLTKELHGLIVATIGRGAFDWVAAEAAGIGVSTFYRWMELGEQGHAQFREFWEDVRKARAQARVAREVAVKPIDWLRMGPGRDRPGQPGWTDPRVEHTGKDGGPIQHEGTVVIIGGSQEEYVQKLKALREKP